MKLVIVSGMSGAGKTVALKSMEDMGFYCVDNMPIFLITKFAGAVASGSDKRKIAIGVDIRSGEELPGLRDIFRELDGKRISYEILFLDASDKVLLKRYKETRRTHPLARDGRIEDGIREERRELAWLRDRADYVLDTSMLLTRDLRAELMEIYSEDRTFKNLYVTVMSFGFKYGIPEDADLVFDVRFLPNPFYVEGLKEKTGLDKEVRDFVLRFEDGPAFEKKLEDFVDFLIPRYISEGKNQLVIAIGCTGGRHRSVTFAEQLYGHLRRDASFGIKIEHRDIKRN